MKTFIQLAGICLLLLTTAATAQKTMKADEIISMIDQGQAVELKNVTITGHLGFVKVKDREVKDKSMFGTDTYESHVNVPISFTNCTFQEDVIGYYKDDDEDELYNAMFHEDVVFENCIFQGEALFKYSEFDKMSKFSKSRFEEEALFKYSEFSRNADFQN